MKVYLFNDILLPDNTDCPKMSIKRLRPFFVYLSYI